MRAWTNCKRTISASHTHPHLTFCLLGPLSQDVFGHMFGYAVKDMYKPLERGLNGGTPSYTQATGGAE